MLLAMGITVFSAGVDGGFGGSGSGSHGGSNGGRNNFWGAFGFKITLQRRADMLTDGGINKNAYENGLKSHSGMIVLYQNNPVGTCDTKYNPDSEYVTTSGYATTTVNNVGVSEQAFCSVLGLDYNEYRSQVKYMFRKNKGTDPDLSKIMTYFTEELNSESEDGLLYDREKRSNFYDLFEGTLNSHKGLTSGITKEEFMSNVGVLVIEPIFSLSNGNGLATLDGMMTFQTADHFCGAIPDRVIAEERFRWWFTYYKGFNKDNISPTHMNALYGARDGFTTYYGMKILGTVTNVYDINGTQIKWSAKSIDEVLRDTGNNQEQGFLVFGMAYAGSSKAATNLTVRATQNSDGSFTVDTISSTISQQKGDMQVPSDMSKPTQNNGIMGGQLENYGDISTLTTSLWYDYYKDYSIEKYGSYLVKGTGKYDYIENQVQAFKDTLSGTMNAKTESVSSGDFNVGQKYKPNWKHQTPQGTASAFAQSLFSGGYVSSSLVNVTKPTTGVDLNDLAYNLTAQANNNSKTGPTDLVSTNNWWNAGSGSVETSTDADASYGVAVEFLMKPAKTSSYITFAKLKYDENLNGTLTVEKNDKVTYNKTDEGKFTIDKKRYYVTAVSNCKANSSYKLSDSNRTGQSFWDVVKSNIRNGETFTEQDFKNLVSNYLTSENITSSSTKMNASVSVGSDKTCGYSVFVLEIDAPERIKVTTKFDLQDYQLNFIHQDLLSPVNGVLRSSMESVAVLGSGGSYYCPIQNGTTHYRYNKSYEYNLVHPKGTTDGKSIDISRRGNPFLYGNNAIGVRRDLDTIRKGIRENGNSERYSYAYNISRGNFGDIRTISPLSTNKLPQNAKGALIGKLRMTYNLTPTSEGNPVSSAIRNSRGTIFDGTAERVQWSSSWVQGGRAPQEAIHNSHSVVNNDGDKIFCSYEQLSRSGARPLEYNGLGVYDLYVIVKDTIYKYSTDAIATGTNPNLQNIANDVKKGATIDSHKLDSRYNHLEGRSNETFLLGRKAVIADSDYKLKYYPEVGMRAYLADSSSERSGVINGKSSITPMTVLTIAEKIRSTQPSSMYLMRLSSEPGGTTMAEGTVYSDTMGTGTNSKKASQYKSGEKYNGRSEHELPVIYGGSDVTVKVAPKGMKLHLYGYALDLVNYDEDKNGLKVASNRTQPYNNIVNDQSSAHRDPYTTWGNDDTNSVEKMRTQYNTWVESVVNSLSADVTLKVTDKGENTSNNTDGVKAFNGFNVSMPRFKADDYKVDDYVGTYNIVVKRGEIDRTTTEYRLLISQIAKDYGCSQNEAETVFNKSGLYQSIVNSIEDIKDSFNKSQNVNTSENGVHAVRLDATNDNWYDEEVKTFVVRRYESRPLEIKDLVLTDKIDYNLTPDSNAGNKDKNGNKTGGQQAKYDTRIGQWYLTLYLKYDAKNKVPGSVSSQVGNVDNLYMTGDTFYKPGEDSNSANKVQDGYNVIMNNLYIKGADFKIPSASTSETLW